MVAVKSNSYTNKRFFLRLDNKLNLKYRIIKSPEKLSSEENSQQQFSILKNISAGGILFLVSKSIPTGTILEIELELLDKEEPIKCLVKVVRVKEIGKDKNYEVGACFLDLSSSQRNRILKYVKGEW